VEVFPNIVFVSFVILVEYVASFVMFSLMNLSPHMLNEKKNKCVFESNASLH
jgi:hypothetical protein